MGGRCAGWAPEADSCRSSLLADPGADVARGSRGCRTRQALANGGRGEVADIVMQLRREGGTPRVASRAQQVSNSRSSGTPKGCWSIRCSATAYDAPGGRDRTPLGPPARRTDMPGTWTGIHTEQVRSSNINNGNTTRQRGRHQNRGGGGGLGDIDRLIPP